jgi:AGZA family xanthine/uracil permease-like MFS transporter
MWAALTCTFSGLVGTSTSGAYIESATGIREGERTGLAAVAMRLFFAASRFFIPLVEPLQDLQFTYGPALIVVSVLMLGSVKKIEFDDLTESVPAFVMIVMLLFTHNIANPLTAGLVAYPVVKAATGRLKEFTWGAVVLGAVCLVYYMFGLPH